MTARLLCITVGSVGAGLAGCFPVTGERIVARDLGQAVPVFQELPPELVLGYAPAPGARRTYAAAELSRLEQRYGLAEEAVGSACFMRPVETLTPERVAAALQAAMPAAHIVLLEYSRQPVPPGELRFPESGLDNPRATAAESPLLWRGQVCRPGQADFPVWAKVRIRVAGTRAVAAETLSPGRPIERAQFRLEPYEGPARLPEPSQIVGRVPRRRIPEGATIEAQLLEEPEEVVRGERVRVEVRSGQARLLLEGQAQGSGRRGDTIQVRNPATGRVFRAQVRDQGQVLLTAGWSALSRGGQ